MILTKNNPYRPAKRKFPKGEPEKLRDTPTRKAYALLCDKDDSLIIEYLSAATLKSMTSSLRRMSIENHDGKRRFKLRDNGDDKTFTIYRVC